LILNCDEDRSQLKTRRSLPSAFCKLLKKLEAKSKATRVPKRVIRKRIKDKKNVSSKTKPKEPKVE
jgi:ribosome-associated protein